jgi:uncharacterized protein YfeS
VQSDEDEHCNLLHSVKPLFEFYVMARTYNSFGGHSTLSLIPDFLIAEAPSFGSAISELTVTFHFPTSGPPRSSLENLYAQFHADRLKLPKVAFGRNRGKMSIDVSSKLIDGSEREFYRGPSLSLFSGAYHETVESLKLMGSKLTRKDEFEFDSFMRHCLQCEARIPRDEEALSTLVTRLNERRAAIRDAMTPWERLGIDWRDYHPDARHILDDPFYWEQANDFAPHGNDTGADLLSDYRAWLKGQPACDPIEFYENLTSRWGFHEDAADPMIRGALDEAAVALAFAEVKLRGKCDPRVLALARHAVQRQRQEALSATDVLIREDRLKSLELIEGKLEAADTR